MSFESLQHVILHGHSGPVISLLYPHDENPRYDKIYLISGGADFTVRVWDLKQETLVHTFTCHGGWYLFLSNFKIVFF